MRYIEKLQQEVREKDARIEDLEACINDLVIYLSLPKFVDDISVSKYDILTRLGRY